MNTYELYICYCQYFVILLLQAGLSLMAMFAIQWIYALVTLLVAFLLWFYIGKTCPGAFPGMKPFQV